MKFLACRICRYILLNKTVITAVVMYALLFVQGASAEMASHQDRLKVGDSCAACHAGHGKRRTPMLRDSVPGLCYECHGKGTYGALTMTAQNIYFASRKRYHHPVDETARYHKQTETLPEKSPAAPRHVSCLDCHNPHISEKNDPTKGAVGYSASGMRQREAQKISDICYKCHAESPNRPVSNPDTAQQFDPVNTSYHPIERVSRDRSISLVSGAAGSMIECTSCHDPHGSDYEFMLRYNYQATDGAESLSAYELCYSCHKRESILADQSFQQHRRHIVFAGASCKTCHSAHGSRNNSRLIEFNPLVVSPGSTGMLRYMKTGKEVSCFLRCHGADHTGIGVQRK